MFPHFYQFFICLFNEIVCKTFALAGTLKKYSKSNTQRAGLHRITVLFHVQYASTNKVIKEKSQETQGKLFICSLSDIPNLVRKRKMKPFLFLTHT